MRTWHPHGAVCGGVFGLVIGACFAKPDAPSAHDGGVTSMSDTGTVDAATCAIDEDFMDPVATCLPWGISVQNGAAIIARDADLLRISTNGSAGSASCISNTPAQLGRMVLEMPMVAAGSGATTVAELVLSDNSTVSLQIDGYGSGAQLRLVGANSITYSPSAHRWFQLIRNGSTVAAEVSGNGTTWAPLGTRTLSDTLLQSVRVRLAAQFMQTGFGSISQFDNLTLCQ